MTVTRHEPRKVVGTVNAAEFLVAVSVSFGFLTGAAQHGIPWLPVVGLVLGGVIMAPIAARLAGRLPHAPMGTMVGGLVVLVNAVTIIAALGGLPGWVDALLILLAVAVIGAVARHAWHRERTERAAAAPLPPHEPQPRPDARERARPSQSEGSRCITPTARAWTQIQVHGHHP